MVPCGGVVQLAAGQDAQAVPSCGSGHRSSRPVQKDPIPDRRGRTAVAAAMDAEDDESIDCRDCKAPFAFTARAKALRQEQGFSDKPVRCPTCRRAKRTRNDEAAAGGAEAGPSGPNTLGSKLGGKQDNGLTFEEKRVLKKGRKDHAAAADGKDGKDFRKGMDPTDARLLRLAREGKMKRAMHRPEDKVDLNTYQQRLEAQGRSVQTTSAKRERPARQKVRMTAVAAAAAAAAGVPCRPVRPGWQGRTSARRRRSVPVSQGPSRPRRTEPCARQ